MKFGWQKQGVYEQITVSTSASSAGTTYADQVSLEEKQEAAQQIANNISSNVTIDTTTYTIEIIDREIVVKEGENVVEDTTVVSNAVEEAVTDTGITEEEFEDYKADTLNEASIELGIDEKRRVFF